MLIAQPLSTASLAAYAIINYHRMSIGNNMICSDIWRNYQEWNLRQFWNITSGIYAKYHAQIMLLFTKYYPQKVCNFHM